MTAVLRLSRCIGRTSSGGTDRSAKELATLAADGYAVAMYEQLGRTHPDLLQNVAQPAIAHFFNACRNWTSNLPNAFKSAVKRLHAYKDRAYGSAGVS